LHAATSHPAASYPANSYPSMMQAATYYPTSSSFSYHENPDNFSPYYWREPGNPALELSPPPPSEWAQKNPRPPTGGLEDFESFEFSLSQYHEDFEKENGGLLPLQSRYFAEEEDNCRERLAIAERELGQENEDTLDAMRNLAFVFYKQGRYELSETFLHRVVEVGQNVFGNDNLATLETRLHLSFAIQEQGRYSAAEDLQRQVLDSFTKIVGKKDKHTLQTQLSLAVCLMCQKKFEKAASLQHEVLNICYETLGGMDTLTLQATGDVALSHIRLGALSQSMKKRQVELEGWKALKGEFHPQTMVAKLLFAIALSAEGDYPASKIIAEEIYSFRKNEFGTEHPDTPRVLAHLAFCHSKQELDSEALELYQSEWMAKKKVLGATHPDTL
jgi:tetratricopeptide (TPR) repeat protein